MSATGTSTILSFAQQPQAYGQRTYDPTKLNWQKLKTLRMNAGIQQGVQQYQLETGSAGTPTGAYKDGYFFAGDFDMQPRLAGVFGQLLYALLGNVATTADQPVAGMYKHIFKFASDPYALPWMSWRRYIPGRDVNGASRSYGEIGYDCLLQSLSFAIGARGVITVSAQIVGMNGQAKINPVWTYSNSYEDPGTIPMSGYGDALIGGERFKFVGMEFTFTNMLTRPDDEMITGQFTPDDLTVLGRTAQIRTVIKHNNADLLNRVNNGTKDSELWSAYPFTVDTEGGAAFEGSFYSGLNAVGSSPYCLKLRGNRIVWQAGRPLDIRAGQLITQEFIGTLTDPIAGEYVEIELQNTTPTYVWSVAPAVTITGSPQYDVSAATPVAIYPTTTLSTDSAISDFTGATLEAELSYNGTSGDVLAVTAVGQVTLSGSDVQHNAVTIGTVDVTKNGAAGKNLLITFNASATKQMIEDVIESLKFSSANGSLYDRRITITFADPKGGIVTYEQTVDVVA